jgi:hypothetical protein
LPDIELLEGVSSKLFEVIDADNNQSVSRDEIIDACLMYDERVPIDGIEDTFDAVVSFTADMASEDTLNYEQFFLWVVLMFGDCSNAEFVDGTRQFAHALQDALSVKKSKWVTIDDAGHFVLADFELSSEILTSDGVDDDSSESDEVESAPVLVHDGIDALSFASE